MDSAADKARIGREVMARVYAWDDVPDAPGDFFAMTAEHLFADVWTREGLADRDRRLLLLGLLLGLGEHSVVDIQLEAALKNGELDATELREIVVFLAHYAGWPRAATMNGQVESAIRKHGGAR